MAPYIVSKSINQSINRELLCTKGKHLLSVFMSGQPLGCCQGGDEEEEEEGSAMFSFETHSN